jgi:hypothetical protein
MHPNEMKLTPENITKVMKMALELGKSHVDALKEQARRQDFSLLSPGVETI